ncbi:MAG: hypothetical protein LBR48_00515 [Dysgonamonadaceae bacterium]|nr:hypothetical protein [Dysgonamonadaceae bacterium]
MKLFLSLVFLSLSFACFCQQKIIFITDNLTQEAVSFATVQFIDGKGGIYADEQGVAIIPDSVRHIFISQIAYAPKLIDMQLVEDHEKVILTPITNTLPEVVVSNESSKRREIGCLKKKGDYGLIPSPNTNFALFMPYDSAWVSPPWIVSIISFLSDVKGGKEFLYHKSNICFDLRLPDKDGAPGNISIIERRIINNSAKNYSGKEVIKLLEPVLFPEKGVFIVVDFIAPNNSNPRLLISPALDVTGAESSSRTWSRTITNDFEWKKMENEDAAWATTIKDFYGKNAKMNIRMGLQIME